MKRLLPALLSLLALLSLPMYGQESVIKLTTHMKPTDRFNISIKAMARRRSWVPLVWRVEDLPCGTDLSIISSLSSNLS